jgi:hypothetical protein
MAGQGLESQVSIPGRGKYFPFCQYVQTGCGAQLDLHPVCAMDSLYRRKSDVLNGGRLKLRVRNA